MATWTPKAPQQLKKHPNSAWMLQAYSLSRHLQGEPDYKLNVHAQTNCQLSANQQQLLGVDGANGWLRTVSHDLGQAPVIFAQTVMSEDAYQSLRPQLDELGDGSIGESLLFNHQAVKRGPFQYAWIARDSDVFPQELADHYPDITGVWARRSRFYWYEHALLMTEFFVLDSLPRFKPVAAATVYCTRFKNKLLDYSRLIRLHRPLPLLLILWPVYWSLWLANGGFPGWKLLVIFTLGALLMRSSGDVLNDLADMELDRHVARTRYRPLTTGRVGKLEALLLAAILCLAAFLLVLLLNVLTILLSLVALGLALFYPFAKRLTYLPQVVLGLAYNWGVVMAFAASQNQAPLLAWYILLSVLLWTVAYDSFYALADVKDDSRIGIKSTARLWGRHTYKVIAGLQVVVWLMWCWLGIWQQFNGFYFVLLGCCLPLFAYQHYLSWSGSIAGCVKAFGNNHWVGMLIFIGILLQFMA